ncbi:hypothetical protein AB3N58_17765 (plasmid) [Leptospira sp. WS60.C2]
MKKNKTKLRLDRINLKKKSKAIRKSNIRRHRKLFKSQTKKIEEFIYKLRRNRKFVLISLHNRYKYTSDPFHINVNKQFGVEKNEIIDEYLDLAEKCIDFDSSELNIHLADCERIWPSAVTLLCSLQEWIEFGTKNNGLPVPKIRSLDSNHSSVNSYLTHCGFHDYVGRGSKPSSVKYDDNNVVHIRREKNKENLEEREDQIVKLVTSHTKFTPNEIEEFYAIVLTEIFLNVQEHGVTCNDQGWWILAQYHPQHKIISLNVADNGIGFRLSLTTGPQQQEIISEIDNLPENDHKFILHAMKENISGAYNASSKNGILFKNYIRGARRGNGLERIKETCNKLKIEFSILSHFGYVFFDKNGILINSGSRMNRIFGGTLYHFNIPVERYTL